ncbi:heterokaryon incompatibility protein-domain-containing protein [Dendryphion nanum]|uniref:Heterokaryon incompatibility protein-domain-containing protein n=1 Tax=Dendryphion nanum TaxID=256645 RepID=A0A9P9I8S7_9PLEO|nr:heterokaryon incompatibility protein-domain-containing protein [Dendryphion nanum]
MRLLNVRTMTLESFGSQNSIPLYAILSHTWNAEELTFDDLQGQKASCFPGFWKVEQSCNQTRLDGLRYIWIDTCCIDKRSSAELSETINSMFKWYGESVRCYAFLQDVDQCSDIEEFRWFPADKDLSPNQEAQIRGSQLAKSRWWTRGWTLQELISPTVFEFYDSNFKLIGSRIELLRVVSIVSGINEEILLHDTKLENLGVAERMSWAADRETTRAEDMAYSLLGIFNIHMPMLYGEGERAFVRLQEEIIKISNDHSIFAWSGSYHDNRALLAPRSSFFRTANRILPLRHWENASEYAMTNAGLDIRLPLYEVFPYTVSDTGRDNRCRRRRWIAPLACRYSMNFSGRIAIELEETTEKDIYVVYARSQRLFVIDINAEDASRHMKSILIRQRAYTDDMRANTRDNKKCVIQWKGHQNSLKSKDCWPREVWSMDRDVFWVKRSAHIMGGLRLYSGNKSDVILRMGYERLESARAVTWGESWVALEAIQPGSSIQECCEGYLKADSESQTNERAQIVLSMPEIIIHAKIGNQIILEEDVFLVEIQMETKGKQTGQRSGR